MPKSLPEFRAGSGSVGTSAQPLSAGGRVVYHVVVQAAGGNAGDVKVGPIGLSGVGFVLDAGERTPPIYVDDLSKIEVVGTQASQGYNWIAS